MALLALVFAFVFGFIGSVMATNRQTSAVGGFCWGFFLGVIGLVHRDDAGAGGGCVVILGVVLALAFCGVIGAVIAHTKYRSLLGGFCAGFSLGIGGLILFSLLPDGELAPEPTGATPKAWWKAEATS